MRMVHSFFIFLLTSIMFLACKNDQESSDQDNSINQGNGVALDAPENLWVSPYGGRYRDSILWYNDSIIWTSASQNESISSRRDTWQLLSHEAESNTSGRYYFKLAGDEKYTYLDYSEKESDVQVFRLPIDTFPALSDAKKLPFNWGVDPKVFMTARKLNALKPANPNPPFEEISGILDYVIVALDYEKYSNRIVHSRFRKKILDQIILDYYLERGVDPFNSFLKFEEMAFKERQEHSTVVMEKGTAIRAKIEQKLRDAGVKLD